MRVYDETKIVRILDLCLSPHYDGRRRVLISKCQSRLVSGVRCMMRHLLPLLLLLAPPSSPSYLVGVGRADITGPAAEVIQSYLISYFSS